MNNPHAANHKLHQSQWNETHYQRFRELVLSRTGLFFNPRQQEALARGVLTAAGQAGCEGLESYYHLLQQAKTNSDLWDSLIGALTVSETYFFRDPTQIEALRRYILPDLIARAGQNRRLRLWSAGCASGEESYTLAILLRQLIPDLERWSIFILATDINKRVLRQAAAGCYRDWSFRQIDPAVRDRYFTRQDQCFQLDPQVRRMVTFAYLNLAEDAYPSLTTNTAAMDLILCRNVAIYLPEAVTGEMVSRFHHSLLPGGWLVMGATETSIPIYQQFNTFNFDGAFVNQKTDGAGVLPLPSAPHRFGDTGVGKTPRVPTLQPPPPLFSRSFVSRSLPSSVSPPPATGPATLPPEPADPYLTGLALLEQRCYEEARPYFLACLEQKPTFALTYHQLARLHANTGHLPAARQWAEQALEHDPLLVETHYILALINQESGFLDQAITRLKKTLYLAPDHLLAHFNLVSLYQRLNRPELAARHRSQAIRLAAGLPPDQLLPDADGLTAGRLLTMLNTTE
jgi:chemotaxis protein methyltransferase CheR